MKKLLLGTTALIGAVSLAGAAYAGGAPVHSGGAGSSMGGSGLSVSVGGFADFQAGFADQDSAFETGAFSREAKFQNDTEVHISVDGKADNGLKYGAVIELNADTSADADGDGGNADKTYLYLESSAGRVELGSNTGAQNTLAVSAASVARATGGVDGDWYDFVSVGAGYLTTQELPAAEAGEGAAREDANKITYYSPVFSGVQLGVSYAPDEGDSGTAAGFTGENNSNQENAFGLGLNYTGQYDNVGIMASVTGEFSEAEPPAAGAAATIEDTAAWALGLGLTFEGFSVAGSYADWSDSGLAIGAAQDDQNSWSLGAAYETGPFGISVTYLASEGGGATELEFDNLVVGADYQLAPGLVPYVEVSFFDTDDNNAATTDNDGSVVLVGAELSF